MLKILSIITITLLFIISSLIFWLALSPDTFFQVFSNYPVVGQTIDKINNPNLTLSSLQATSSEAVLGDSGQIIIRDNIWNVEIAKNDKDRISGLSNRKTLYSNRGMLFVFDKMTNQSFWMKDMLIPIDMIFFDNNWKIVLIQSNVEPDTFPTIFGNKIKSQYVLEINALEANAYNLQIGDQAIYLNK